MTAEEWPSASDPGSLWAAVRPVLTERKVRLWGAECCRRVIRPTVRTPRYERYAGWLASDHWLQAVEAAEEYADGRIDRRALRARRGITSGGPYNLFRILSGVGGFSPDDLFRAVGSVGGEFGVPSRPEVCDLLREVFGDPFHPVTLLPSWRSSPALDLARTMYEGRDFAAMPILADALEEAGCDNPDILAHCRGPGPHVRGCWVVDLVLGKS